MLETVLAIIYAVAVIAFLFFGGSVFLHISIDEKRDGDRTWFVNAFLGGFMYLLTTAAVLACFLI